jgi:hypothetical protein
MLKLLRRLFGMDSEAASPQTEYDPVYGLPQRAVDEWLARNPRLREEYTVEAWLARNPLLRAEYEAGRTMGGRPSTRSGDHRDIDAEPDARRAIHPTNSVMHAIRTAATHQARSLP